MTEMIVFHDFPMPPSANLLYRNIAVRDRFGNARGGRAKTADYIQYSKDCATWALINRESLAKATQALALARKAYPNIKLHVTSVFYFPYEKLFCKDGSVKRLDSSNRIKALHDELSLILGIDDSYFWSGTFDKQVADRERVFVQIKLPEIK